LRNSNFTAFFGLDFLIPRILFIGKNISFAEAITAYWGGISNFLALNILDLLF